MDICMISRSWWIGQVEKIGGNVKRYAATAKLKWRMKDPFMFRSSGWCGVGEADQPWRPR